MGIGFMYPEERDIHPLERSQNMEIVVQGRTFSIDLLLSGTSGRVFLVTALLDYEQVPFRLDGKEGLIHQITLPEEMDFSRDLVLPLEVDIPTDGIHDFIVIAFDTTILAQPNADTLMSRFAAIGRRTRLLVGDATSTPALPLPIRAQPIQNEEEVWAIDDLWLSRAECGLGYRQRHPLSMGCQLYWDEDPKERRYPFTIWVGDNYRTVNEPGERRGIVLFHNYHLVPFGGNRFVTLVDVPQGHELVLPMHVELHDGVNIIQAFEIYEPYTSFFENTDSFVYKTTFPAAIIWK
ncbi:hypothetical protein D6833_04065 [Candidatus Parcubacteria bacterium]|nr:MAG: hypothetical protein D6833_04065 [Candidatus Parcubacteria bacterium]